jgi:lipopolysaccharide export system protein LptA
LQASAVLLGVVTCAMPGAFAQSTVSGVPNAVQGFATNRDQPINIEANSFELRNNEGVAIFTGNVHVIQGDTHLRSRTLKVFYVQDGGKQDKGPTRPAPAAAPGPDGQQQIRRLEAGGGVVVTQKDQTANGDEGTFDTRTNAVTLRGNVVITQAGNVMRGDRLLVNLTTGMSTVHGGRVQAIINPSQAGAKPGQAGVNPGQRIGIMQ